MPADEVTHGTDVDASRARTGPRHAAPKKPLFTRFHMPAGKAIATVAMPTAVLMGMGFTSTLALADSNGSAPSPTAKSLTADEYKDCVTALTDSPDASASPSPSASASATDSATPTPSSTAGTSKNSSDTGTDSGTGSPSDPGSGDKATPAPSAGTSGSDSGGDATATPTPSPSESGNLLDTIGDTIGDIFTGGSTATTDPTPTASASPSATAGSSSSSSSSSSSASKSSDSGTAGPAGDTVKDVAATATATATETPAPTASATPSASASPSASPAPTDCPTATDDVSGVDNAVPVADDPWYLNASSLLLKGADYQGIVEVKTANGTKKKALKYVISGGTDIGDLHQTVKDQQTGKTYHVQAGKGTTSTIRDGDTVMYTESISGNLFGLIPITFSPDNPPPLNIPLIYFTNVKVVQAAQFGGTLHVPGMHLYTTDGVG
ncbi:hypothetical protein [Streptomyces sp. H51]|uniref:hypothetical protein n=1 Tax=Streptomyces sp. H51 TaxID=3111770 RepID=UPI002D7664DB|nr:hypothetical protein [Streptomyces sp. H51]